MVIPPRTRHVKVQLDSQGRQVAFSVGSPPGQPVLQQHAATAPPVTSVPFTYVPAIPTITDPYPSVTMVPVPHVQPMMGTSWVQRTAVYSQQSLPQPVPIPTAKVQPPIGQVQVPPSATAHTYAFNVMDYQRQWTTGTEGAVGSALLPPTLPVRGHAARRQHDRNQLILMQTRSQRGGGQVHNQGGAVAEWMYPAADERDTEEFGMLRGSSTPFAPIRNRGGGGRGRSSGKRRQRFAKHGRHRF